MVKVYVRYGKLICKVWPIRIGYVMMREYFRKVYGSGSDAIRQVLSTCPNSHEWLIRG